LLSFKGKERPSREIAAVFSFGERQGRVGKLRLEGEIVEEAARLDPEAALEPRAFRGIGEALAESQIDAQASKQRDLPGSEHERDRSFPVGLIPEVAENLAFQFDPVAVKREARAWQRDREGGDDDPRKPGSDEIGVLDRQFACEGPLRDFQQIGIDPAAAVNRQMPAPLHGLGVGGIAQQGQAEKACPDDPAGHPSRTDETRLRSYRRCNAC
jgi:hypothetical protein